MAFGVLAGQITVIFLEVLLGYVGARSGIIKDRDSKFLSDFIMKLLLPCTMLAGAAVEGEPELLTQAGILFVLLLLLFVVTTALCRVSSWLHHDTPGKYAVLVGTAAMPNCGFIGLPLCSALLGTARGTVFAGMAMASYNVWFFTYVVCLFRPGEKIRLKTFITPTNIATVAMLVLLSRGKTTSSAILIAAAFVGAMVSMGFVLLISQRVKRMSLLVVCGVMIGYICSALTDFLVTFADDSSIVNLHNWSLGSFSGMSWENVKTMAAVCGVTLLLTFLLSKPIRAYQLGEVYAQNMGVPLRAFRTALILLSSVLSACVTAFAGPISFVGIAVPHLMKSLFKSAEPLVMIPACFLGGGVFCLFCDLIARTAFAPTEVSISSVTAVFGAPIVIYMMIHRKAA